ncbi:hypothetical protein [Legionella maceachernii]|uniref:Uncharacterized protein n=1 Tax=Legionella maceachernii TaxID=466 RepID=A0A0W0WGL3_9GAMM|nr:hypothetical protein [Legionella maceachernii]KTD31485.1 hypothetical protein Lmac_0233 [Legionella maceachernii]SJZ94645.1 hypothetical protein SAMN02745128_01542 [Legionella maceachernii]SUP03361.1 Uncharacterised protein [Legionella maceachernii]
MLKDLHIAHITGTARVLQNKLFADRVEFGLPRRSIGQMFFKPYESKKEFIFCARHTLQPVALIGLGILSPIGVAIIPAVFLAASLGCLVIGGLAKSLGNQESALWWFKAAEEIVSRLLQTIINLVVLPVSAVALLTRSVSTGLQAASIYDYDAPPEDKNSESMVHADDNYPESMVHA